MKNYKTSLPVSLSFAELAWIIVILLSLFLAHIKTDDIEKDSETKGSISKEQQIESLSNQVNSLRRQLTQAVERNDKRDSEEIKALKKKLAETIRKKEKRSNEKIADLNKQIEESLKKQENVKKLQDSQENSIRRELVGIKGDFNRVAIIFDRSQSMRGERWEDAVEVVRNWLRYLPFNECVLITFGDEVEIFPKKRNGIGNNDGYVNVARSTEGINNREKLIEFLKDIKPRGHTNTYRALEVAYEYVDLDTIVLFTDGRPKDGLKGLDYNNTFDIKKLYEKHKDIPINTVGLGKYYDDPKFSEFLINIASNTGGVFLGR